MLLWLLTGALCLGVFGLCAGVGKPVADLVREFLEDVFPAKKIEPLDK